MRKMAAVHADPSSCGEDKMVEMAMTIFKGIVMDYFSRREVALLVKSVPNCPATAPLPPPAPSLALSATSSNFQHLLGNFLRANRSQQSTYFVGCEEGLAFLVYLCEGQNCVKLFKKRSRYEDNWLADMAEAELLKGRGLRSGGS